MIQTIVDYIKDSSGLDRVVLCLFDYPVFDVFAEEMERVKRELEVRREVERERVVLETEWELRKRKRRVLR